MRGFLSSVWGLSWAAVVVGAGASAETVELSKHLAVWQGPINVGIVRDGSKALLIDCGDESVQEALKAMGIESVEEVLFTHHHRDQACGAWRLASAGAMLIVPAREQAWFDRVGDYWNNAKSRWNLYSLRPHHLMLAEPVDVCATVTGGESLTWGPAKIEVLDTPGHTDGSVSYVVEVDGQRVAFTGDAIYDAGQVWEIGSLQKGTMTKDYHGFLGALPELKESLERVKAAKPAMLVPSHGRMMREPERAIDLVCRRLDACYEKYVAISALRHYFPKMFTDYAGRPGQMPIRPGKPVPDCLRHIGTSWVLVAEKAAFVMDCGSPRVIAGLKEMVARGEIESIDGLWVTHYHDDHVAAIPEFEKEFGVTCVTDSHVAAVISNPLAWRLPCISPARAQIDQAASDGDTWTWHGFKFTTYFFPGQTLYHGGLLIEGRGLKMFFVGDSFTMAGVDDYCVQNRNWLGEGVGFDRCIVLLDKLRPTHLFNCHVKEAFDFTADECRFMRANLAEREKLFAQLLPWDDPNYGIDDSWVRAMPYEQDGRPGEEISLSVVFTNHSTAPRLAECRAVLPRFWSAEKTEWGRAEIAAKQDGEVQLALTIPNSIEAGRYVIPIDVRYGDRLLPEWTEAIVVVQK